MRRTLLILIAVTALLPLTNRGQVRVEPLDIRQRTLANGMRVVTLRDASSPTVSVHVWYDVGGKNDPPGRSGFAHMFEHMMFKSTKNMPGETFDRLTEDVGGFNNASTWDDFTNYYQVVPANHLERILWAEAERMVNLNVDEANFASERDVVKEEFRQGVLARPYGRFFEYIQSLSYKFHPYRRGVIGNLDELSAASRDDADLFYRTFYRPDNAVLIVVGDFEQAGLDGWIDRYFGTLARPSAAIPRVTEREPERTSDLRFERKAPNVPFPAVAITLLGPPSNSRDLAALRVAETLLSGGESSRLYLALVRTGLAQEAAFLNDIKTDRSLLVLYAIASEGKAPKAIEDALWAEIEKLRAVAVTPRELQKAKNQLITQVVQNRETNDGKAIAIERAIAYAGDATAVNREVAELGAVTAADIRRVMRTYFGAGKRMVLHYSNEEGGDK